MHELKNISYLGIIYITMILALNKFKVLKLPYKLNAWTKTQRNHVLHMTTLTSYREIIIYDDSATRSSANDIARLNKELKLIKVNRPQLTLYSSSLLLTQQPEIYKNIFTQSQRLWAIFDNTMSIQLDCIELPDFYISGKNQLTEEETVEKWNKCIDTRLQSIQNLNKVSTELNEKKYLSKELQCALDIVKLASYMSKSLQMNLIGKYVTNNSERSPSTSTSTTAVQANVKLSATINKNDKSPVTIADFAVQALIIDRLSQYFPDDKFIAEEDSHVFKSAFINDIHEENNDLKILNKIKLALTQVTNEEWSNERLFRALDLGQFDGFSYNNKSSSSSSSSTNRRVWVLDPIDGTKGFLRNQHYCIALALLIDDEPQLSVLGCPNLQLNEVIESVGNSQANIITNITKISEIHRPYEFENIKNIIMNNKTIDDISIVTASPDVSTDTVNLFPVNSGTLFYAVSGTGAYAKSLNMPHDAGFEVNVDSLNIKNSLPYAILCEATESSHGNRNVTENLSKKMNLKNTFLRLDGQCKYGVVGSGAAHGNLRLPPIGYQEKIWDHAPGIHFVQEAGGKVTDLNGKKIDFLKFGRFLDPKITGIVSSCGDQFHNYLIDIVNKELNDQNNNKNNKPRIFGQEN